MNALRQLFNRYKVHVIYGAIIVVLLLCMTLSINKCSSTRGEYQNNIEALVDTIKYYQDRNGNLVATKRAFESDIKTLKILNERLYSQIDSLKLKKSDVSQIVYVDGKIENPQKDTTYVVRYDTISRGFSKDFDFTNNYRTLQGTIAYYNDSLSFNIAKDIIMFDYTLAIDKDNLIYIKSTNPYVSYNEISGFTLPKQKQKRWSIGPGISYGYDPWQRKTTASVSVSLTYGILQW